MTGIKGECKLFSGEVHKIVNVEIVKKEKKVKAPMYHDNVFQRRRFIVEMEGAKGRNFQNSYFDSFFNLNTRNIKLNIKKKIGMYYKNLDR